MPHRPHCPGLERDLGAADRTRQVQAMAAVDRYLVRRREGLVLLFTPPFDNTTLEPGYIKGYLPGVRENGGQYTHAAIWSAMAFAVLGEGDKASELGRAVRHGRRRLRRAAARRPGRLDVVHRVRRLDVSRRHAIDPRISSPRRAVERRPMHSACVGQLRDQLPVYEIVVDNPDRVSRGVVSVELDGILLGGDPIPLVDDAATHRARIRFGGE
jgi:cyclic beta-1,2-glucan synthetase